ncbi:MAG TPA: hypothetical protein VK970_09045 [Candidatus Methylacidiphilales bacterium]|nr:hypothetical protein [Candidatus Methylacidiphilales bacterium]
MSAAPTPHDSRSGTSPWIKSVIGLVCLLLVPVFYVLSVGPAAPYTRLNRTYLNAGGSKVIIIVDCRAPGKEYIPSQIYTPLFQACVDHPALLNFVDSWLSVWGHRFAMIDLSLVMKKDPAPTAFAPSPSPGTPAPAPVSPASP